MDCKQLFADEDAVSPVIGVILMVAITVILAAVIGAFVLGITGQQSTVPQSSWDVNAVDESNNGTIDNVTMRMQTGDQLRREGLAVAIPGNETALGSGTLTAGNRISIELDQTAVNPAGEEIMVLWTPEGGGESAVLVGYTFQTEYGHDFADVSV